MIMQIGGGTEKSEKDSLGVGSSASIMKLINSRETRIFDLGPLGQI
jgi:hypothetical protein